MTTPTFPGGSAIAITGMSCRLPGGITTPAELWDALVAGRDLISDTPAPDEPRPESLFPAGLLDRGDFEGFDRKHFRVPNFEASTLDPQQRWLSEVVDEALQDAGIAPSSLRGTNTGVWIGSSSIDQATHTLGADYGTVVTALGAAPSLLSNRLSYNFDFRGPSMTIDTACSASLVAFHNAWIALQTGDADLAVVGGANVLLNEHNTRAFVMSGMLGPGGRCRPFDTAGDGYVRSEGAGVVILQRAEDARAHGSPIRALILGSGVNSDGRSRTGIVRPSLDSQRELLRRVYERSGVDPATVDYVQAHGTGTSDGDGVEARSLGDVLGRAPGRDRALLVGAVKSNVGHLEGGAGVIGLIATVLAMRHATAPPVVHHTDPREGLADHGLEVPTHPRPWPTRDTHVAGVSSYGFGGTNAHVIIRSPAPVSDGRGADGPDVRHQTADTAHLIPVSASTPAALAATAQRWADHIRPNHQLGALAATASHRRDHLRHRAGVVADTPELAHQALAALASGDEHPALVGPRPVGRVDKVVFVFSGHGGHRERMGERLAATEPAFAAARDAANDALAAHLHRAPWRPGDPLRGMDTIQPAQFATQVGLAALWREWGITPDIVIGHSLGEVAAAHTAGALTLDDAARLVVERSALLAEASAHGGLLATDLDAETAEKEAAEAGATVAVYNGPSATVLAGPHAVLADLNARLTRDGARTHLFEEATPVHSPLITEHTHRLEEALAGLRPGAARTTMWSTAIGAPIDGTDLDAAYWGRQMRAPVRLHSAIAALAARHRCLFIEIAPRPVLVGALTDTLAHVPGYDPADAPVVAATRPVADADYDERADLLRALGTVATHGRVPAWPVPADLDAVDLPPRCWARPDAEHVAEHARAVAALTGAATEQERDEAATHLLRRIVTGLTGRSEKELPFDAPLYELGVGSLDVYRLRARIRRITGADTQVMPDTTLVDVAGMLTAWATGQAAERTTHETAADTSTPKTGETTSARTTESSGAPG
ncbi:type I polyketide synthase [Nocardiopsis gilva YIM 90087]|uniref:Type I polyketide synthase n=1 Tax=Nocardiopsis gilva YIM 90087 TaxID=1235441 RepID=A0A223SBB6_9ACTN|nr:type I polyketide synthase [Nocardiopsis gilva]ASU85385.1 type I polyketide synthase [Nocardiopsis gilva YIM 90087]